MKVCYQFRMSSIANKQVHAHTDAHTQPAQTHLQCGVTSLPANCRQVHRYNVCVCVCACSVSLTMRRSLSTCVCVCVCMFLHVICACVCVVSRTLNRALFDFDFHSLEFRAHLGSARH